MYADSLSKSAKSSLISRNITVSGRRTSIRLEPEMWQALSDISSREKCTVHNICTLVDLRKKPRTTLTAAIRVFIMLYFRAASTAEGHTRAGHGDFEFMKKRAGVINDAVLFTKQKPQAIIRQQHIA
jgi:predicted DNA-binding ribbon-helix-helix protein